MNFTANNRTLGDISINDGVAKMHFTCHSLFFRFPGETKIDGKSYPMGIQLYCDNFNKGSDIVKASIFEVPVKIAEGTETQSKFFDNFDEYNKLSVPMKLTIKNWGNLYDVFVKYNGVYMYRSHINFPPCKKDIEWLYDSKPQIINQQLYDKIRDLLDKEKCPNGNARLKYFEITEDLYKFTIN